MADCRGMSGGFLGALAWRVGAAALGVTCE
jgi:hypothetical protein